MSTIDFLRGRVVERAPDSVVIDTGALGYRVLVSSATAGAVAEVGAEAMLYTHLQVREDAWTLYGFATREERTLFNQLLTVTGVGPRVALAALSAVTPGQLAAMIGAEDVRALARVPGIGQKTAQRIVLDLKGKLPALGDTPATTRPAANGATTEAAQALRDLGFRPEEIDEALRSLPQDRKLSDEETVSLALRHLGTRR